MAEAWRKQLYRAAFISKLSDSAAEAAETQTWLAFAAKCRYMDQAKATELEETYSRVLERLVNLINTSENWIVPTRTT